MEGQPVEHHLPPRRPAAAQHHDGQEHEDRAVDAEAVGRDALPGQEDADPHGVRRQGDPAHRRPAPARPPHPQRLAHPLRRAGGEVGGGHPAMLTGPPGATSLGVMTTRAHRYDAIVLAPETVSTHLLRLNLSVPGFESTGVPDEWVGLVVPGQFQVRYYTIRSHRGDEVVLDVVVHDRGLVTEWASGECLGERVVVTGAQSSYVVPPGAAWLLLVGDLTAMPAMARIADSTDLPTRVWAEVPDDLAGYLPERADVTWLSPPAQGQSRLAEVVEGIDWPPGEGYFWMAGESAQMRAIRKHLMRERRLANAAYDVMGYWRAVTARQPRAVDPEPILRAGKASGKSDEEIWAAYDEAATGGV